MRRFVIIAPRRREVGSGGDSSRGPRIFLQFLRAHRFLVKHGFKEPIELVACTLNSQSDFRRTHYVKLVEVTLPSSESRSVTEAQRENRRPENPNLL